MNLRALRSISTSLIVLLAFALPAVAQELTAEEAMIHRRAVEAAVWGMPLEGTRGFLVGTRTDLGGDWNDVVYFTKPMESRHGFLTANNQTPYVVSSLNTKDGPLVVEVPAASEKAKYFGSFVDAWDFPFADVGPDGADKGAGGKYLFRPPGYEGEVPDGYLVFRPHTYAVHTALRPVAEPGGTLEDQVTYAKKLKVYRLSEASNPPPTNFIDAYPKKWDTLPKYDISFFHDLAEAINEEPVLERDLVMMGLLKSIGIEKGRPFDPDEKMTRILERAISDAYDYMQHIFVTRAFANFIEGTQWSTFNLSKEQAKAGWPFVTKDRMLIDERANLYHYATFMPKVLGGGSFYLTNLYDSEGTLLDGKSTYKMTVPADTPAGDFWSAIAYSFATHGFIVGAERVGISSLEKDSLQVNEDGSVDLYFAPSAPEGHESNWISTGENFWVCLRLYGPEKRLFDKSWSLPDIQKLESKDTSAAASDAEPVSVTSSNYVRAESDLQMKLWIKNLDCFGKFNHNRKPYEEKRVTVRGNRDTLYSFGVWDLRSPVTITLPETEGRYQSLMIVNQDHSIWGLYGPRTGTLTEEKAGTRYVFLALRTFMNPNDEQDMKAAHRLQDAVRVEQADMGKFDVPGWNKEEVEQMRAAVNRVSATVSDAGKLFGRKENLDPVYWMLGAALGWGGLPAEAASYVNVVPEENDGKTAYTLTTKDVPVDAFWSVTLYDGDGYMLANKYKAYSFNNVTAKKAKDGSITIHFGGDPKADNFLPIVEGWNYIVRLYRPRKEILDGTWTFPAPKVAD